ncbi:GD22163 [Drosophila simulans]|uniref:GD22163 n=1 Tax=Drosophila simulans TaxID=7240 RepID=B4Q384_DROSI|nr:GD22163 [Drosophila simulans]
MDPVALSESMGVRRKFTMRKTNVLPTCPCAWIFGVVSSSGFEAVKAIMCLSGTAEPNGFRNFVLGVFQSKPFEVGPMGRMPSCGCFWTLE